MKNAGISKAATPILCILIPTGIILMQFGFIFFLLATLPSLVAYYSDHERGKPTFKIVCCFNIAATMPSLAPMFHASLHMKHYDISSVLRDSSVWLIVYSGAAVGWFMIYLCRLIATFIITVSAEYTIMSLEGMQKRLVEEWGDQLVESYSTSK